MSVEIRKFIISIGKESDLFRWIQKHRITLWKELTVSLLFGLLVMAKGIANWRSLLAAGLFLVDTEAGGIGSNAVRGCGVDEALFTRRINLASGSFIVAASQAKPGVMLPSSVNEGSRFRCKRKRSAFDASNDRLSMEDRSSLIEEFVSIADNANGL